MMTRHAGLVLVTSAVLLTPHALDVQTKQFPLESADGLRLHNVQAAPVTHEGRKGLRVTMTEETARRAASMTQAERNQNPMHWLAVIEGLEFSNGVIEVELAGAPAADAFEGARGFVGIAFRLQKDANTYDAFYLRPTNGRADDQERRNRSAQYISPPDWPWFRLRKETPAKYESYVDLVPGAWTKIKIEVSGDRARLYVRDTDQPTLIVNDVKSGPNGSGAVALWIDPGTVAHFRNLTVQPSATASSATKARPDAP
jgi:hypothetical protein